MVSYRNILTRSARNVGYLESAVPRKIVGDPLLLLKHVPFLVSKHSAHQKGSILIKAILTDGSPLTVVIYLQSSLPFSASVY